MFKKSKKKRTTRIVSWADYGAMIPLTCPTCGATFSTKNINYIGANPVYYGLDLGASKRCQVAKHQVTKFVPNYEIYKKGVW